MLGQVARGGRTVLLDHVEEAGTVGITVQGQFEIGSLGIEAVLGFGDHLGGLGHTRLGDQGPIAVDQGCKDQQAQEDVGHQAAVLFEKELRFVHCFAESFGFGDVLLCHSCYLCF